MKEDKIPDHYEKIRRKFDRFFNAVEALGEVTRNQGPLDVKTSHLIQLAAAAAIRSEGSVHSHLRRALDAGASPEEIYHAVILLTSTIGFPTVAAALSWIDDYMGKDGS
ncbi:MAG: carboxymuconolactone decarboxylase family protein [Deltaproteobacteria bacterium]|nr:carboxymuconolactone decarboxylase family protein [Deltaproteobacteria bacterium]